MVRTYVGFLFNKLRRRTGKAATTYRKYLGHRVYKLVRKTLTQLQEPVYAQSMNYMRAGTPVVLQPDEAYLKRFRAGNPYGIFYHHFFDAYRTLVLSGYRNRVE